MKQSLQLRTSQHLALTPQLQQSIRLLQLSTTELNQELERFLMENPMLEREEGAPLDALADGSVLEVLSEGAPLVALAGVAQVRTVPVMAASPNRAAAAVVARRVLII